MITFKNVSKSYQRGSSEVRALDDVSLTIARGEFVALMGPSGSGKSTLLNLMTGLDRPTKGSVLVDGITLDGMNDDQLAKLRGSKIGIVFQAFNLIPVLSAQQNVALPLLPHRMSRAERSTRALTALRIVGLEARKDHHPSELSGGEQQRVAIARALVADPELIVADEPTGDLDARNAEDILTLLRHLRREQNKTIVMVTHDTRVEGYVDAVYQIDKGRLQAPLSVRGAA